MSDASAGAEAPQPSVAIGAPQTDEQLAEQARTGLVNAKQAHSDAVAHVDFVREHVAGMIAGAEAAVAQAAAAVDAAQARVENGGQS